MPSVRSAALAVSSAPLWWCGHQTLGRALTGVGDLHTAVLCFSRSLRLNPDNEELRQNDLQVTLLLLDKCHMLSRNRDFGVAHFRNHV